MKEELPGEENFEGRIAELIREKGLNDPEVRELITQWTMRRETVVGRNRVDAIQFNIDRANVFLAAGEVDTALEDLFDAAWNADNERGTKSSEAEECGRLYTEIKNKIDRIKKENGIEE